MSDPTCAGCYHAMHEHDGMGDCRHPDGRRTTGLCACAGFVDPRPTDTDPKDGAT